MRPWFPDKNSQASLASSQLSLVVGNHGYNDFPSEKFFAWKITTMLGAQNVTDVAVSFQQRVGGYAFHTYTDESGNKQCSTGAESPAAPLLDFSWLQSKAVTEGGNITITLPGQSTPTKCASYHESDNPGHSVCFLPASQAASGSEPTRIPVLHKDGSATLYFTHVSPQPAGSLEPSDATFAAPTGCISKPSPDKNEGITWQVLLGACVGSLVLGMAVTALVVYCRGRKSGEEDHQAFEAALLDVM